MREWITAWPTEAVWLLFWCGSMCRGGFLHWLGRRLRGLDASRAAWLDRPMVARAEHLVETYGAPMVVASYLTVGLQSAIHVATGALRMSTRRYLPALVLGSAVWATIYTTIGMSVVYAALGRISPWWLLLAGACAMLLWGATRLLRDRADQPSS